MPIIHSWDLARTYSNLRLQRQGGLISFGVGHFHPSSLPVNTGESERSELPSDDPVVEAAAQTDSEFISFDNVRLLHQRAVSSSGLDCLGDDTQHRTRELDSTSVWTSSEIHNKNNVDIIRPTSPLENAAESELDESSSDESAPSPGTGSPCPANEGPWEKTESLHPQSPDLFPCSEEAASQEGPELDESSSVESVPSPGTGSPCPANEGPWEKTESLDPESSDHFSCCNEAVSQYGPELSESRSDESEPLAAQTHVEFRNHSTVRILCPRRLVWYSVEHLHPYSLSVNAAEQKFRFLCPDGLLRYYEELLYPSSLSDNAAESEANESSLDDSTQPPVTGSPCHPCCANERPLENTETLDPGSPDLVSGEEDIAVSKEGPELSELSSDESALTPAAQTDLGIRKKSKLSLLHPGRLFSCGGRRNHSDSPPVNTSAPEHNDSSEDESALTPAAQTDLGIRKKSKLRLLHPGRLFRCGGRRNHSDSPLVNAAEPELNVSTPEEFVPSGAQTDSEYSRNSGSETLKKKEKRKNTKKRK